MEFNSIELMEFIKQIGMDKAFLHVTNKSMTESKKHCDKKIQSVDRIKLEDNGCYCNISILVVRYKDNVELFIGNNKTLKMFYGSLRKKMLEW